jgi:hypothetical protein
MTISPSSQAAIAGAAPTVSAVAAKPKAAALSWVDDLVDAMMGLLIDVCCCPQRGLSMILAKAVPGSTTSKFIIG